MACGRNHTRRREQTWSMSTLGDVLDHNDPIVDTLGLALSNVSNQLDFEMELLTEKMPMSESLLSKALQDAEQRVLQISASSIPDDMAPELHERYQSGVDELIGRFLTQAARLNNAQSSQKLEMYATAPMLRSVGQQLEKEMQSMAKMMPMNPNEMNYHLQKAVSRTTRSAQRMAAELPHEAQARLQADTGSLMEMFQGLVTSHNNKKVIHLCDKWQAAVVKKAARMMNDKFNKGLWQLNDEDYREEIRLMKAKAYNRFRVDVGDMLEKQMLEEYRERLSDAIDTIANQLKK